MKKTSRNGIDRAKKHLKRIREIVAQKPSPFAGMTKEEAIEKMRQTRQRIWEKKLAARA